MRKFTKGHTFMPNKNFDKLTRIGEVPSRLYIILGLILMGINTLICVFAPAINPAVCGSIFIALYGIFKGLREPIKTFLNAKTTHPTSRQEA